MKRLVYDCEIVRLIPPKGINIDFYDSEDENAYWYRFGDGYQYCGGWNDFENMGISVIGVCDIDTEEQFYFSSQAVKATATYYPIPEFSKFVANHEVWGFNSHDFDDRLCRVQLLWVWSNFDLLKMNPAPKLPLEKVAIALRFAGKHRTNSDLDNLAGACLDALTLNGAGILTDDNIKCIPRLTVEYDPKGKTGVEIVIEQL